MTRSIEQRAADTIRVLSMDAVQKANSGHPGMPMGMADLAVVLWSQYLEDDPKTPDWPDRDRFVLSNGHGSMLLYSLLHLSGFPMPMDELAVMARKFARHKTSHILRDSHTLEQSFRRHGFAVDDIALVNRAELGYRAASPDKPDVMINTRIVARAI